VSGTFRCGRVAILGRTNAGKSTLLNRLVGEKVAIVSGTPQTTRQLITGVYNGEDAQVVFVDTPGLHKPQHLMNRRMLDQSYGAMGDVDAVLLLADAGDGIGRGDQFAISRVEDGGRPWLMALNKVDRVKPKDKLLPMIEGLQGRKGLRAVVPISAANGSGVDGLVQELVAMLPEAPALYPRDMTSDQTERFFVAELIREKVLHATKQEVPHATAIFIEEMIEEPREKGGPILMVKAALAVEKPNQKGIIIGKAGSMLKKIGTAARLDIEQQLGRRCHLDIFVKVLAHWRDNERLIGDVLADPRADAARLEDELGDS
jgi:GTP-binding protein Era